ncbi:uncharacterized protein METZ01_LOCUS177813, partial [marine metagenome]
MTKNQNIGYTLTSKTVKQNRKIDFRAYFSIHWHVTPSQNGL